MAIPKNEHMQTGNTLLYCLFVIVAFIAIVAVKAVNKEDSKNGKSNSDDTDNEDISTSEKVHGTITPPTENPDKYKANPTPSRENTSTIQERRYGRSYTN